ncbi:MAG: ArgR family transcriptional regulator [Coriobacteriaceae bacterium]|nr:ArgR family transcriptional regulator [Coriobacteriaceae bacterium]
MLATRNERQEAIRRTVRTQRIRTQRALVASLKEQGFEVTQATVSRDITDMDLQKSGDGTYALREDLRLQQVASTSVDKVRRVGNQVLVFTTPGAAQSVAATLDAVAFSEVVGCIAGDDTILVICGDEVAGASFEAEIEKFISKD